MYTHETNPSCDQSIVTHVLFDRKWSLLVHSQALRAVSPLRNHWSDSDLHIVLIPNELIWHELISLPRCPMDQLRSPALCMTRVQIVSTAYALLDID